MHSAVKTAKAFHSSRREVSGLGKDQSTFRALGRPGFRYVSAGAGYLRARSRRARFALCGNVLLLLKSKVAGGRRSTGWRSSSWQSTMPCCAPCLRPAARHGVPDAGCGCWVSSARCCAVQRASARGSPFLASATGRNWPPRQVLPRWQPCPGDATLMPPPASLRVGRVPHRCAAPLQHKHG